MNVSEFLPVSELQTIGRAELRAVLMALNKVTMLRPATILCDSKYIVDGCSGQAKKWQRKTTSGPVIHTYLWKQILILLEVYGSHVTVHHVPPHSGLTKNDLVDQLAGQGRMRSPLWTVNNIMLDATVRDTQDDTEVQIIGTRARTSPPMTRERQDFLPWTPESVVVLSEGGTLVGTPASHCATPERQIIPPIYQLDTPSPRMSLDFTEFDI